MRAASPLTALPEPTDRIKGRRRDEPFLSLTDEGLAFRALMIGMHDVILCATLVGNQAPVVARMWERMNNPVDGDLVVESTAPYLSTPREKVTAFGILLGHREEWADTEAEWRAAVDAGDIDGGERLTDWAWYIQYGPGPDDVCRWVNCTFRTVLTERPRPDY